MFLRPEWDVLGGGNYTTLSANADVNSLEVGKWYFKGSGISLTNFSFSGAYLFWTSYNISGSPSTFKHQYAYSLTDSAVYHRNAWGGGWTDWVRLDNFGCSTPEALASILGAGDTDSFYGMMFNGGAATDNDDCDNFANNSVWIIGVSQNPAHRPGSTTNRIIVFTCGTRISNYRQTVQIAIESKTNTIYTREFKDGTWRDWV